MIDPSSSDHIGVAPAARQGLMAVCAEASAEEMARALVACGGAPEVQDVRPPEAGLVMLRGRIGGDGAPFNIGEATVTRAVVRLAGGVLGYSYLLGRSPERARLAAIIDALGQDAAMRAKLETALVAPVMARREAELVRQREEAAATRVNFFTLVRGED
jgi:alpha-D-ribose 1-methylphosphonate 5-triphosphate synthase subunit PhnG